MGGKDLLEHGEMFDREVIMYDVSWMKCLTCMDGYANRSLAQIANIPIANIA